MGMNFPDAPVANQLSNSLWYGYRWRDDADDTQVWRRAKPRVIAAGPVDIYTYPVPLPTKYRSFQLRLDSIKRNTTTTERLMLCVENYWADSHIWQSMYAYHSLPTAVGGGLALKNSAGVNSCGIPVSIFHKNHPYDSASAVIDIDPGWETPGQGGTCRISCGSYASGYMTFSMTAGGRLNYTKRWEYIYLLYIANDGSAQFPTSGNHVLIGYE